MKTRYLTKSQEPYQGFNTKLLNWLLVLNVQLLVEIEKLLVRVSKLKERNGRYIPS